MLKKYIFRPGINRETTNYAQEGGWWDCDKVRFRSSSPEKIGGWAKYTSEPFIGTARALFNWVDLNSEDLMVIGTNAKLYAERGSATFDITPIVNTSNADNPIHTTNGSTTIRVDFTAHGTNIGDYIIITGATDVGGVLAAELNKEHRVTAIPSADYFEIVVTTPATSSVAGGGGIMVVVDILLAVGLDVGVPGTGWGAGPWGRDGWGSGYPLPVTTTEQIRLWAMCTFGENLLANPRGQEIFYWQPSIGYSSANRATPISALPGASDTPVYSNWIVSTDQRHIVAFGTNPIGTDDQDNLLIRWCDQEDPAMWTPTATNSAGDLRVPFGSYIVTAQQTRQEILVWTDTSLQSMQYVGAPYTFTLQTLSADISIAGPNAAVTVNNVTYWMGKEKFYAYSGRVETLPCTVRRYVFNNFNFSQASQVQAGVSERFGEVIWFYPSDGSLFLDRYVIYNYLENIWYYGTLSRSAWLESRVRGKPFAAAYDGYIYQHETGLDNGETNPPSPINAYIETADFDIDDGEKFTFVQRVIPDIDFEGSVEAYPQVTYAIKARNFPGGGFSNEDVRVVSKTVEAQIDRYTTQVWVRLRGRQTAIRIASNTVGVHWQLGATRLDLRPDGRKS